MQVPVVSGEEKWVFTLVTSVWANEELILFQAIYKGKLAASLSSIDSVSMKDSLAVGMLFSISSAGTHWSTHEMMHEFIDKTLSPYFELKKKECGLPPEQKSLW
jgi:hypothetical protein